MTSLRKIRAQKRGLRAEWWAAMALRLKGYRVLERGFKTKLGEIDIIARKRDLVAIVEVKSRKDIATALDAVGVSSQRRIANAADLWLANQPDYSRISVRFDIVAVIPGKWPVHFPGAF